MLKGCSYIIIINSDFISSIIYKGSIFLAIYLPLSKDLTFFYFVSESAGRFSFLASITTL